MVARRRKLHGEVGGDPAPVQDDDPVGERDRLVHIVRDQQHGGTVPFVQAGQQGVHTGPGECVERAERLVREEQFGLAYQGAGERDPLL